MPCGVHEEECACCDARSRNGRFARLVPSRGSDQLAEPPVDEDWPEVFPEVEALDGAAVLELDVSDEEESDEVVDFDSLDFDSLESDDEESDESPADEPDRLSVR